MSLTMSRRDRVAIHATLNEALDALMPAIQHARNRSEYGPTVMPETAAETAAVVETLRTTADAITRRRHDHTGTGAACAVMADAAMDLRSVAYRIESCAAERSTRSGDWVDTSDNARCEWSRLHGQRSMMQVMFPLHD